MMRLSLFGAYIAERYIDISREKEYLPGRCDQSSKPPEKDLPHRVQSALKTPRASPLSMFTLHAEAQTTT